MASPFQFLGDRDSREKMPTSSATGDDNRQFLRHCCRNILICTGDKC